MPEAVQISFECLPLRSVGRLDVPLDASDDFRAFGQRLKGAIEKHGAHNSYYLRGGSCVFHLTSDPTIGLLAYRFEGTLLTDPTDTRTLAADLQVELSGESCDWLTRPVAEWFEQTVVRAVQVEFDRYIAAGDLQRAVQRLEALQRECDEHGGFLGMYL